MVASGPITGPVTGPITIRPLIAADIEPSFRLASQVFIDGSTLHRALNIGLDAYRAYLWPSFAAMVSDGLSVVAVDPTNEDILGCLIVTRFRPETATVAVSARAFAPLAALTSELVTQYLSKRPLGSDDAVLVDMAAVKQSAAGLGAYRAMRTFVAPVARDLGFRYILGELSSAATQHVVLNQMGHRNMAEVEFASFKFEQSRPFSSITRPTKIIMSEGSLV